MVAKVNSPNALAQAQGQETIDSVSWRRLLTRTACPFSSQQLRFWLLRASPPSSRLLSLVGRASPFSTEELRWWSRPLASKKLRWRSRPLVPKKLGRKISLSFIMHLSFGGLQEALQREKILVPRVLPGKFARSNYYQELRVAPTTALHSWPTCAGIHDYKRF